MKVSRLFWVLFLLFDACIDPFDASINTSQSSIVVDGLITDQPGPYTVKLYKTLAFADQLDKVVWIGGAAIAVYDENGLKENLVEVTAGNYQTQTLRGVIGSTYYITITTKDGFKYKSFPEKILPVGEFSDLKYQFVRNQLETDGLTSSNGFNIFVNATLLPEQNGLMRWRWTGIYEVKTFPELATKFTSGAHPVLVPDPALCSGYKLERNDGVLTGKITKATECTCCNCWVSQYNEAPLLSEKKFTSNNAIKDLNIGFIEANRRTFYNKYYLDVEQMSVSQTSYDFWSKVKTQKENGSNLFQTPGAVTLGNIQAVSSDAPSIIGLFSASAIKRRVLTIYRKDVPLSLPQIDTVTFSCSLYYKNSTTKRPSFW